MKEIVINTTDEGLAALLQLLVDNHNQFPQNEKIKLTINKTTKEDETK